MTLIQALQALFALLVVLGLIGLAAFAARRFRLFPGLGGPRADKSLAVVEWLPLDARRKAVLLRRGERVHLVLLGPTSECVVESFDASALPKLEPEIHAAGYRGQRQTPILSSADYENYDDPPGEWHGLTHRQPGKPDGRRR